MLIIWHSPRRHARDRPVCESWFVTVTSMAADPSPTDFSPTRVARRADVLGRSITSLVVTPAVVAHRGASGHRPEHTLAAYRTAIRLGADALELDLVITADGVLVVRHESELSTTTDVASRPELAGHRTTRMSDGHRTTGWFTEDLTLAELRTLTTRERMPHLRPGSAAYDGAERVVTFDEVLTLVRTESALAGRQVALMVELKSPAHFDALGLPLDGPLLADLRRHGLDDPRAPVTLMSFEPAILRRLAEQTRVAIVQLLDTGDRRPADLVAVGDPRTYADLASPRGLAEIDDYADGIGVHKDLVLPPRGDGTLGEASPLVRDAHRRWLTVHVWTLRAENRFLPVDLRRGPDPAAPGDLLAEARAFLGAGVDGLITDHPEVGVLSLAEVAQQRRLL